MAGKTKTLTGRRKARLEQKAEVLKALAHPTRLFLVEELEKGERCVCELTAMVDVDVSTISRHLAQLRHAGVISAEKRSNQVFYSLEIPCLGSLFACIEDMLEK